MLHLTCLTPIRIQEDGAGRCALSGSGHLSGLPVGDSGLYLRYVLRALTSDLDRWDGPGVYRPAPCSVLVGC